MAYLLCAVHSDAMWMPKFLRLAYGGPLFCSGVTDILYLLQEEKLMPFLDCSGAIFFSANEPLPNVSEKNIYCVQIFLGSLQAD